MSSVLGRESARRFRQGLAKGPEDVGAPIRQNPPRLACWVRVVAAPEATCFEDETTADDSGDYRGVVTHRVSSGGWRDTSEDIRITPIGGAVMTVDVPYLALRMGDFWIDGDEEQIGWPRYMALAPADEIDGEGTEGIVSVGTQRWHGDKIFRDHVIVRKNGSEAGIDLSSTTTEPLLSMVNDEEEPASIVGEVEDNGSSHIVITGRNGNYAYLDLVHPDDETYSGYVSIRAGGAGSIAQIYLGDFTITVGPLTDGGFVFSNRIFSGDGFVGKFGVGSTASPTWGASDSVVIGDVTLNFTNGIFTGAS